VLAYDLPVAAVVPIACAADAEYVPHCAALLHSLATTHEPARVHVHFLHDGDLERSLLDELGDYATGLGLEWSPVLVDGDILARFPDHHRFGRVGWYRVALPELLPGLDRVLYLDCDVIVTDTLVPLLSVDVSDVAVGAVTNPLYPGTPSTLVTDLGLPSTDRYFNSGVLLMNLDRWRRAGIGNALQAFIDRGEGMDLWPDQTALNAVLWDDRRPLAPRWNAQNPVFELRPPQLPFTAAEVDDARRSPAVVHFIGPYKPWHYRSKHPMRSLYFEHLSHTPWAGREIEGATLAHRALRLLPAAFGLRVERQLRRWAQRTPHVVNR
jgi:lipopolysaccharide biosynthesis glycosyltransferase